MRPYVGGIIPPVTPSPDNMTGQSLRRCSTTCLPLTITQSRMDTFEAIQCPVGSIPAGNPCRSIHLRIVRS